MSAIAAVREICLALPEAEEKLSHGAPTFFVRKRVFAIFAANHHGQVGEALWIPAPPGMQEQWLEERPDAYFRPPYVGVKGWVGILIAKVPADVLSAHLREAHAQIAKKKR